MQYTLLGESIIFLGFQSPVAPVSRMQDLCNCIETSSVTK